jgi:hypothetical protein
MNLPQALHTAARRFCANQHYHWSLEYKRLLGSGQDRVAGDYSNAAYGLFPRYRLDDAMQIEVERLTGLEFPSLEEARNLILEAGDRATSSLLQKFNRSNEACVALKDELKAFELYIAGLDAIQLGHIEPLPYRRVLARSESERLWQQLRASWGVTGSWYPISECAQHTNVIAFHEELWERRNGTSLLFQATQERVIDRCFLLSEGTQHYEIDCSLIDPIYRGEESFLTSDFEWLVYSSHESSIAVAGWLADFYRARWPDWKSVACRGPFHTSDLRGSSEMPKR